MGIVYKAQDTRLYRPVAIKILPVQFVTDDKIRQLFIREAQAASILNHPNICTIYDVGNVEDIYFFVMEFVDGENLRKILERHGPFPESQVVDIAIEVCNALNVAHETGIIHRDIKSDNIMIAKNGFVKVMDFGLAKFTTNFSENRIESPKKKYKSLNSSPVSNKNNHSICATTNNSLLGTVSYMSPELVDKKQIDHRCDIFSLGVVLYELLTGHLPFQGKSKAEILQKIINDDPAKNLESNGSISNKILEIVKQMLNKNPNHRYQNIKALTNDLKYLKNQNNNLMHYSWINIFKILPFSSMQKVVLFTLIIFTLIIVSYFVILKKSSKTSISDDVKLHTIPVAASPNYYEDYPAISPDGNYIAYVSDVSGNFDIWIKNLNNKRAINLTKENLGEDMQPAWSPDGTKLVFRSDRYGGGLFVVSRDGREVIKVTDFGTDPNWSLDGTKIVFGDFQGNVPTLCHEMWLIDILSKKLIKILSKRSGWLYAKPTWSSDGNWIFYRIGQGSKSKIEAFSLQTQKVIEILGGKHMFDSPILSKDMKWLYFRSDQGGVSDIWKVKLNVTSKEIKIITEPIQKTVGIGVLKFNITPNADKLVFSKMNRILTQVSGKAGYSEIWLNSIKTEPNIYFTKQKTYDFGLKHTLDAEFSPDGNWLAFESDRNGKLDIWIVSTNGNDLRRITDDDHSNTGPSWSPDGKWIVYDSGGGNLADIRIISFDGGKPRQLFQNDWADWLPDWSPNGKHIIYTSNRTGDWEIWRVSVVDGKETRLTHHSGYDFGGVWSPDGKEIAFVSDRSGFRNLWIMSANGENCKQITYFNERTVGRTIGWNTGGRKLFFYRQKHGVRNIWSVQIEDNRMEQLTNFNHPSFSASHWGGLSVHNNKIVYSVIKKEGDIWMIENFDDISHAKPE